MSYKEWEVFSENPKMFGIDSCPRVSFEGGRKVNVNLFFWVGCVYGEM